MNRRFGHSQTKAVLAVVDAGSMDGSVFIQGNVAPSITDPIIPKRALEHQHHLATDMAVHGDARTASCPQEMGSLACLGHRDLRCGNTDAEFFPRPIASVIGFGVPEWTGQIVLAEASRAARAWR